MSFGTTLKKLVVNGVTEANAGTTGCTAGVSEFAFITMVVTAAYSKTKSVTYTVSSLFTSDPV